MLANLPLSKRLRSLYLANNRIATISPSLHLSAPNLTSLTLTNNVIAELGDLEPLRELRSLQFLSLLGNPVRERKWYREWIIWRLKPLRVLDFQRIRDKARPSFPAELQALTAPIAGTNGGKNALSDTGRSPHGTDDLHLGDGHQNVHENRPVDGRAQAGCRTSGAIDDGGGKRAGQGRDRQCNKRGRGATAGEKPEGWMAP